MIFGKDHREKLAKTKPDTQAKDVMRLIGEAWKKLSEKEKAKYEKRAAEDKERYEKEKENGVT
jgi:galactose-1-phosphate uridylyltransferase